MEPAEVWVEPAEVRLAVRVPLARPEVGAPVRLLLLPVREDAKVGTNTA